MRMRVDLLVVVNLILPNTPGAIEIRVRLA